MTETMFKTSLALFTEAILHSPDHFTGTVDGEQGKWHRLMVSLRPKGSRDKIETKIKHAISLNFYEVQLLALAFVGHGMDEKAIAYLVPNNVTGAQVAEARQAVLSVDARAYVSYPVKAII